MAALDKLTAVALLAGEIARLRDIVRRLEERVEQHTSKCDTMTLCSWSEPCTCGNAALKAEALAAVKETP